MGLYDYISGIAVLIYVFMLLIMLNAQRTKLRNSFLGLLVISIMWAGGSWLMRRQAYPHYEFWYHISLIGMLYLPIMYFRFINEFIHDKKRWYIDLYLILLTGIFIVNIFTGLIIPPPIIQLIDGVEVMVYESFNWSVSLIVILSVVIIVHMLSAFYAGVKRDPKLKKITQPITLGIVFLFAGHILLLFPVFSGFPIDILSGIFNSIFLVYALARRSPFKLKMLMSENVGYLISFFLSISALMILEPMLSSYLTRLNATTQMYVISFLVLFVALISSFYILWKVVIVGSFVKEVEEKEVLLSEFSSTITRSLETENIFRETVGVMEKIVGKHNIYISMRSPSKLYRLIYSNQPLADLSISFRKDNPVIKRLKTESHINVGDFRFDNAYQTMWEKEKYDLVSLDISHIFGLYSDEEVLGTLLISDSQSKKRISLHDEVKLQQICTMLSIALKNSASYEKAIVESRTDDLTGLYNRKYFYQLIENQFDKARSSSLGLVLMNLDDFKLYNQLYGVKNADDALKVIGTIIKGSVGEEGYVCRFSGKEFIFILPNFDVYRTLELVTKIRKQIKLHAVGNQKTLEKQITTSVGVCVYPYGASNKDELIDNVQQAVYQVKRKGKNAVKVFDTFVNGEVAEPIALNATFDEYKSTVYALMAAIDAKDHYTFSHSENVASYGVQFATALGLNADIVENIRQAALLHDIGKISISENILNKPGRLDEDEYEIMKTHVDASIDIIRHLPSLDYVIPAVLGHHEKYDGTGYPRGTKGEDIPLTARILCIVDTFDAVTSGRIYTSPKEVENALKIIENEAGRQFDPNLALEFSDFVKAGKIKMEGLKAALKEEESDSFEADAAAVS